MLNRGIERKGEEIESPKKAFRLATLKTATIAPTLSVQRMNRNEFTRYSCAWGQFVSSIVWLQEGLKQSTVPGIKRGCSKRQQGEPGLQTLKVVLLRVMPERPVADFQNLSGLGSHAIGFGQCGLQISPLGRRHHLFEINSIGRNLHIIRLGKRCAYRRTDTIDAVRQDSGADFTTTFQRHCSFDGVFQFPNVSRPIV